MDSLDLGKMIEKDQQELNELIDNSLQWLKAITLITFRAMAF